MKKLNQIMQSILVATILMGWMVLAQAELADKEVIIIDSCAPGYYKEDGVCWVEPIPGGGGPTGGGVPDLDLDDTGPLGPGEFVGPVLTLEICENHLYDSALHRADVLASCKAQIPANARTWATNHCEGRDSVECYDRSYIVTVKLEEVDCQDQYEAAFNREIDELAACVAHIE